MTETGDIVVEVGPCGHDGAATWLAAGFHDFRDPGDL